MAIAKRRGKNAVKQLKSCIQYETMFAYLFFSFNSHVLYKDTDRFQQRLSKIFSFTVMEELKPMRQSGQQTFLERDKSTMSTANQEESINLALLAGYLSPLLKIVASYNVANFRF